VIPPTPAAGATGAGRTVLGILVALSASHLINDTLQALLPAIYPMLKASFGLTFTQIGMITLSYQLTASILQPVVGTYTDRNPKPYSLRLRHGHHALRARVPVAGAELR
jgi:FSR family fosmidomycin resistance protein-like MFS transporter